MRNRINVGLEKTTANDMRKQNVNGVEKEMKINKPAESTDMTTDKNKLHLDSNRNSNI